MSYEVAVTGAMIASWGGFGAAVAVAVRRGARLRHARAGDAPVAGQPRSGSPCSAAVTTHRPTPSRSDEVWETFLGPGRPGQLDRRLDPGTDDVVRAEAGPVDAASGSWFGAVGAGTGAEFDADLDAGPGDQLGAFVTAPDAAAFAAVFGPQFADFDDAFGAAGARFDAPCLDDRTRSALAACVFSAAPVDHVWWTILVVDPALHDTPSHLRLIGHFETEFAAVDTAEQLEHDLNECLVPGEAALTATAIGIEPEAPSSAGGGRAQPVPGRIRRPGPVRP